MRGLKKLTSILKYKDSWVKFEDCIEGMKKLEDKSIDLCLTDPPYNNNIRTVTKERNPYSFSKKIPYKDKMSNDDYIDWCIKWFHQISRVCKRALIFPGNKNLKYWWKYIDLDLDLLIWYDKKKQGAASCAHFNKRDPILCLNIKQKYDCNIIDYTYPYYNYHDFIHPCPKPLPLIKDYLIKPLNPTSVLDPFMGSGTTLEACIQLGIPCYGYELMEEYRVDMEKRIERSKYYKKPQSLETWM